MAWGGGDTTRHEAARALAEGSAWTVRTGSRWLRFEGWFANTAGQAQSSGRAFTRSGALVRAVRAQERQRRHADAAGDRIVAQARRIYGGEEPREQGNGELVTFADVQAAGGVPDVHAEPGEVRCERPGCPNRATLEEIITPYGYPLVCDEHGREVRAWLELLKLPLEDRPMATGITTGVWLRAALREGPVPMGERAEWLLEERP